MVLQQLIICLIEKNPGKQREILVRNQDRNAIPSVHGSSMELLAGAEQTRVWQTQAQCQL